MQHSVQVTIKRIRGYFYIFNLKNYSSCTPKSTIFFAKSWAYDVLHISRVFIAFIAEMYTLLTSHYEYITPKRKCIYYIRMCKVSQQLSLNWCFTIFERTIFTKKEQVQASTPRRRLSTNMAK